MLFVLDVGPQVWWQSIHFAKPGAASISRLREYAERQMAMGHAVSLAMDSSLHPSTAVLFIFSFSSPLDGILDSDEELAVKAEGHFDIDLDEAKPHLSHAGQLQQYATLSLDGSTSHDILWTMLLRALNNWADWKLLQTGKFISSGSSLLAVPQSDSISHGVVWLMKEVSVWHGHLLLIVQCTVQRHLWPLKATISTKGRAPQSVLLPTGVIAQLISVVSSKEVLVSVDGHLSLWSIDAILALSKDPQRPGGTENGSRSGTGASDPAADASALCSRDPSHSEQLGGSLLEEGLSECPGELPAKRRKLEDPSGSSIQATNAQMDKPARLQMLEGALAMSLMPAHMVTTENCQTQQVEVAQSLSKCTEQIRTTNQNGHSSEVAVLPMSRKDVVIKAALLSHCYSTQELFTCQLSWVLLRALGENNQRYLCPPCKMRIPEVHQEDDNQSLCDEVPGLDMLPMDCQPLSLNAPVADELPLPLPHPLPVPYRPVAPAFVQCSTLTGLTAGRLGEGHLQHRTPRLYRIFRFMWTASSNKNAESQEAAVRLASKSPVPEGPPKVAVEVVDMTTPDKLRMLQDVYFVSKCCVLPSVLDGVASHYPNRTTFSRCPVTKADGAALFLPHWVPHTLHANGALQKDVSCTNPNGMPFEGPRPQPNGNGHVVRPPIKQLTPQCEALLHLCRWYAISSWEGWGATTTGWCPEQLHRNQPCHSKERCTLQPSADDVASVIEKVVQALDQSCGTPHILEAIPLAIHDAVKETDAKHLLVPLEKPEMVVGYLEQGKMQINSAALPFWSSIPLAPFHKRKNIRYLVLTPTLYHAKPTTEESHSGQLGTFSSETLEVQIGEFFKALQAMYCGHGLGQCTPLPFIPEVYDPSQPPSDTLTLRQGQVHLFRSSSAPYPPSPISPNSGPTAGTPRPLSPGSSPASSCPLASALQTNDASMGTSRHLEAKGIFCFSGGRVADCGSKDQDTLFLQQLQSWCESYGRRVKEYARYLPSCDVIVLFVVDPSDAPAPAPGRMVRYWEALLPLISEKFGESPAVLMQVVPRCHVLVGKEQEAKLQHWAHHLQEGWKATGQTPAGHQPNATEATDLGCLLATLHDIAFSLYNRISTLSRPVLPGVGRPKHAGLPGCYSSGASHIINTTLTWQPHIILEPALLAFANTGLSTTVLHCAWMQIPASPTSQGRVVCVWLDSKCQMCHLHEWFMDGDGGTGTQSWLQIFCAILDLSIKAAVWMETRLQAKDPQMVPPRAHLVITSLNEGLSHQELSGWHTLMDHSESKLLRSFASVSFTVACPADMQAAMQFMHLHSTAHVGDFILLPFGPPVGWGRSNMAEFAEPKAARPTLPVAWGLLCCAVDGAALSRLGPTCLRSRSNDIPHQCLMLQLFHHWGDDVVPSPMASSDKDDGTPECGTQAVVCWVLQQLHALCYPSFARCHCLPFHFDALLAFKHLTVAAIHTKDTPS